MKFHITFLIHIKKTIRYQKTILSQSKIFSTEFLAEIPIDSCKQLFCFFDKDDIPIIILYCNKALHKISETCLSWTENQVRN